MIDNFARKSSSLLLVRQLFQRPAHDAAPRSSPLPALLSPVVLDGSSGQAFEVKVNHVYDHLNGTADGMALQN